MDNVQKAQRLQLHQLIIDTTKFDHVYFQPPINVRLEYPCVIYKREETQSVRADNVRYLRHPVYQVTVIERDPDSDIPEHLEDAFEHASIQTRFVSDNLYHSVLNIIL